ncbi:MAG TPA: hypothetical protein VGI23_07760, partial [Steroidobacteraceae bacterium]
MVKELALANIQGNILGGFNKDFQTFVLLKFKSNAAGRAWIKQISDPGSDVSVANSSAELVLQFNAQFKALMRQGKTPEAFIEAEWTNLAISVHGLQALGVDAGKFPDEFRAGMAARNELLGDLGTSDPQHWLAPFGTSDLHAILTVAADSEAKLTARVAVITGTPEFKAGADILLKVEGRTRMDLPGQAGHEHFGFKDGVSQPGIRGVDPPDDPLGAPNQGHPGQDLLWPGEFVLGYPTQIGHFEAGGDSPNSKPGPPSQSGPVWTHDGSYLVFRRLAQDVPGFHRHVAKIAAENNLHRDLAGAKLVGRYKSGCPLESREFQRPGTWPSPTDPGATHHELADSDTLNNNFEFGDDEKGTICPMSAHIRKAYPRDETTDTAQPDSESETQTHRLLRRGIPFGGSFGATSNGKASDPRGLVFQCFQKRIKD